MGWDKCEVIAGLAGIRRKKYGRWESRYGNGDFDPPVFFYPPPPKYQSTLRQEGASGIPFPVKESLILSLQYNYCLVMNSVVKMIDFALYVGCMIC